LTPIRAFVAQINQSLVAHAKRVCSDRSSDISAPIGASCAQINQPLVAQLLLFLARISP
jgi:hypothetical protein